MIDPRTAEEAARLARAAIEAHFSGAPAPASSLDLTSAAFVGLHGPSGSRGFVGTTTPDRPLSTLVPALAVTAATDDPRFLPLTTGELAEHTVEVVLLGEPRAIKEPGELRPGEAVSIRLGLQAATLPPSVAEERGWSAETFVIFACRKAGLTGDAWSRPGAVLEARPSVSARA